MDYKKIIKDRSLRLKILHMLDFIPDKLMLKLQYRVKTGRKLNLDRPKRYTEKLQWYKLYYKEPLMSQCADKYDVRNYVKSLGLEKILNECYGVFDSPEQINFSDMPDKFVLKDTLGGGGSSMIFVNNKKQLDLNRAKDIMLKWINTPPDQKSPGREWIYENRRHRIIAEKLLVADADGDLPDYKFFCFNGKIYCSYMMKNYTMHHELGILGFLDKDFKLLNARRADFKPMTEQPEMPKNYYDMIEIAEKLSSGFPHVRVDLYNICGKIIFGEMTFFNASGYTQFIPDEFDFELGEQFVLPPKIVSYGGI